MTPLTIMKLIVLILLRLMMPMGYTDPQMGVYKGTMKDAPGGMKAPNLALEKLKLDTPAPQAAVMGVIVTIVITLRRAEKLDVPAGSGEEGMRAHPQKDPAAMVHSVAA